MKLPEELVVAISMLKPSSKAGEFGYQCLSVIVSMGVMRVEEKLSQRERFAVSNKDISRQS